MAEPPSNCRNSKWPTSRGPSHWATSATESSRRAPGASRSTYTAVLESHVGESLHSVSRGSGFTDVVEITVSVPSRESVRLSNSPLGLSATPAGCGPTATVPTTELSEVSRTHTVP